MKYRLLTADGSISHKLFDLEDALKEMLQSKAVIAIVAPKSHKVIRTTEDTEAGKLTVELMVAGANRAKIIAIVDSYGDSVDWSYHSLDSIIAEVWQSDLNSGDDPDIWIINEICRVFNVPEVTK